MGDHSQLDSFEKIAIVSAVPETIVAFMSSHLNALRNVYLVSAICGGASRIPHEKIIQNVTYIDISIERKISPLKDVFSLYKLIFPGPVPTYP